EPLSWMIFLGQATWFSLLISPFFLKQDPRPERWFACIALWASVALLFNPVLLPPVSARLGYLVMRLYPAALALCILGVWAAEQIGTFLRGQGVRRAAAAVACVAFVAVVGRDAGATVASYGSEAMAVEREHTSEEWEPSLRFLDARYSRPRVVA